MCSARMRFETPSEFSVSSLEIDALDTADVTAMLDLFSRSIPYPQLRRTIYTSHGVSRYLASLLDQEGLRRYEQFWGVKDDAGRLLAASHTRRLVGRSHLNTCAVDPQLQGQGLGSRLMDHWESMAAAQGAGRLTLDVAEENTHAQRLYRTRGFIASRIVHEYRWEGEPLPPAGEDPELECWPAAMASLETYGFGRFCLVWQDVRHQVDLFEGHFRISSPEERLLSALHQMDKTRTILLRDPQASLSGPWQPTGAIIHMHKDLT